MGKLGEEGGTLAHIRRASLNLPGGPFIIG
jgi:hypothetical protein